MTDHAAMTDPASEMIELAELFRNHPGNPSNITKYEALAKLFGTSPGSAEFYTLLAVVRSRLSDFESLVQSSAKIRQRIRDNGLNALASLSSLIDLQHGGSSWNSERDSRITDAHMSSLVGLEQYFADAHPMRRLNKADRQALIAEMDELLAILANGRLDLDRLLVDAISTAFRDLRLVLEKFPFFGRRLAEEKLIVVASALQAARNVATKGASAETASFIERARHVVTKIAAVVVFVGGVSQGVEVIGGGFGWVAQQAIEQIGGVRLLTDQSQGREPSGADGDAAGPAGAGAAPVET